MVFKMPTHPSQMKKWPTLHLHFKNLEQVFSLYILEKGGSWGYSTLQGARNEGWNEHKFPSAP
jgi:hypothetical protein